ncbi:unnamed protein product [Sphagnum tenellum]
MQVQHGGGRMAAGGGGGGSNMSGLSSRTSPMGNSAAGPNKSVAFCKPPSTIIPAESPGASSSMTRTGTNFCSTSIGGAATSGTHQSLLRAGPRLRAEGLMVPPASDAATLRRQVAALQIDLEAHIDGEQRLQSINQQLRERLELYMKQNHENVERAETELNTLHEDMEHTLELQRRLAQRAAALEKEKKDMECCLQKRVQEFEAEKENLQTCISSMTEDLRTRAEVQEKADQLQEELKITLEMKAKLEEKLHCFSEEAEHLKRKAEEYSNELHSLILKEQVDKKVEKMRKQLLTRRSFKRFQEGVRQQCIDEANKLMAIHQYELHCCKSGFQALCAATYRASQVRQGYERHGQACVQECWRAWKLATVAQRMCKAALQKQAAARVCHTLHSWVAYVIRERHNPEKKLAAMKHWIYNCKKKAFEQWTLNLKTWKLSEKDEHNLTVLAHNHWYNYTLKRMFFKWCQWVTSWARPKKKKLASVQAHINSMTCKQAISAWHCLVHLQWIRRMKYDMAVGQDNMWKRKRTIARLREAVKIVKDRRQHNELGAAFRKLRQGHTVVKAWHNFLQNRRHGRTYKQIAFRHFLQSLRIKSFQMWRDNAAYRKAQKRATQEVNQAIMRAAMVFWRDYHVYHAIKKKKQRRASVHRKRREVKTAKQMLELWWEQMAWKRRAVQLDCLLAIRRQRTVLIASLHSWMHATFDGLLLANAKCHDDLLEAQAQVEEQKHQVTTVDVENLQLIDRLHTMSSEIAYLKTTLNEKQKQEDQLHRALEDSTMLESSMRGEIEQQHLHTEELELEVQNLQKKLQVKNVEDTAGEVRYNLEIQNLEHAVKELRIKLAEKTSQIDSYDKALKETAEKLEGASDQSQEKLASAFEIAGSLRKLLEDRENQFATLEGISRRRELELGEVQRKLSAANCTLAETVECRDARIVELECMLTNKQTEIQETQHLVQELELALDAKESRMRKLEYENKLMSEQNSLKAKTFVSSLSSWAATPVGDTSGSLRGGLHAIQVKESMRHAYVQAKTALQQGSADSSDDGASGLVVSGSGQAQPYAGPHMDDGSGVSQEEPHAYEQQELRFPSHMDQQPTTARQLNTFSPGDPERDVSYHPQAHDANPAEMGMRSLSFQAQDTSQPDWETSFALVSTTRPTPTGPTAEPSYGTLDSHPLDRHPDAAAGGTTSLRTSGEGPFRVVLDDNPGAVDSLHVEIQRLQARIMSRLRDSPPQGTLVDLEQLDRNGARRPGNPRPQPGAPGSRNSARPS